MTTLNPIPATGGVQLRLPKWNTKAPVGIRESYLLDEVKFDLDATLEPQADTSGLDLNEADLEIDKNRLCSPKNVSFFPKFEFTDSCFVCLIGCLLWTQV